MTRLGLRGRVLLAVGLVWILTVCVAVALLRATLASTAGKHNLHHASSASARLLHESKHDVNTSDTAHMVAPPPRPAPKPLTSETVARLLEDVVGSERHRYSVKDNRGHGMDCMRVVFAPVESDTREVIRYLAVYHSRSRVTRQFEVHLAQSFDLLRWEHLRRVAPNADMPVIRVDQTTGRVLVAYEQFLSSTGQSPCANGVREFESVHHLLSGSAEAKAQFRIPNTIAKIEGTPSIHAWDPTARTVSLWFHYHNDTTRRDLVARGALTGFPGAAPLWTAEPHIEYNLDATTAGVSGNVGGRHRLSLNTSSDGRDSDGTRRSTFVVLQEGNVQKPPLWPTDWTAWRVWLHRDNNDSTLTPLHVQTHGGSASVANPWASVLPCPDDTRSCANEGFTSSVPTRSCLVVAYFVFGEGAARGEAGQLLFYTPVNTSS